jgi:hypothetical protein
VRVRFVVGIAAIVAFGLCASALATGPAASQSAKRPLLISNCVKGKFEPKSVIIACGDASFGARGMTWPVWTKKRALGAGTGEINDCDPDCVHGTTRTAPMELRLSKPRRCSNGRHVFSKLRYTWTAGAPVGPASGSVPMGCKLAGI